MTKDQSCRQDIILAPGGSCQPSLKNGQVLREVAFFASWVGYYYRIGSTSPRSEMHQASLLEGVEFSEFKLGYWDESDGLLIVTTLGQVPCIDLPKGFDLSEVGNTSDVLARDI